MSSQNLARIGILSACAVAAYVFESFIPVPVPWARIGISNIVVVITLFGFGIPEAIVVTLIRIVAGNLVLGILISPSFVMSLSGGMAALAVMALARRLLIPPLSVIGVSMLGAVASNTAQIRVFALLFTDGGAPSALLGAFIIMGAAVGFVTGMVSARILEKVTLERSD
jgi:heptaprenyl diphosphate synthase